jgi:copper resistance protein B
MLWRGLTCAALLVGPASAQHAGMDHGPTVFNMIRTELDYTATDGGAFNWSVDGWVGGDVERVWLRSSGEVVDGHVEDAELQLYYGWNVSPFWDVLVGARHDFRPDDTTYLAASIVGLSPYFFETEASVFLSDRGDLSARFEQSIDLLITQQLIAEPYVELNLFAQDVAELGVGGGFSDVELGVQLRYEITRKFAPYVDVSWNRKLGETLINARSAGESAEDSAVRFGLRLWF